METARPFPYQRGYAAIGLHRPKDPANIGGVLRAAYCYGASLVVLGAPRAHANDGAQHGTNTFRAYRHIPTLVGDDLHALIPFDCVPAAVDLVEGACPLPSYQHPQRAFYIFGPEDGTLGKSILSWCEHRVAVPTRECMNLSACVNVVLYDRVAKAMRAARKLDVTNIAKEAS
jgi:tRNA(Leu) C34 or U34 (ribose-2'-O)-methylase TrmL